MFGLSLFDRGASITHTLYVLQLFSQYWCPEPFQEWYSPIGEECVMSGDCYLSI